MWRQPHFDPSHEWKGLIAKAKELGITVANENELSKEDYLKAAAAAWPDVADKMEGWITEANGGT